MSLDFYIRVPEKRSYYRSGGKTLPMAEYDDCFTRCHVDNITHNLGEMARHTPVSDTLTLYNVLWRPEESGLTTTDDIVDLVAEGVRYMITHKDDLIKYNPDNGWGDYDGLLEFAKKVGNACLFNPSCQIEADR